MDRGDSQVTVHGVTKSQTQLSTHVRTRAHTHTHRIVILEKFQNAISTQPHKNHNL